jgi:hypothetical protein
LLSPSASSFAQERISRTRLPPRESTSVIVNRCVTSSGSRASFTSRARSSISRAVSAPAGAAASATPSITPSTTIGFFQPMMPRTIPGPAQKEKQMRT